jgi:N,N dimethylarginine dimethylhydrolase, eukaryotic
MDAFPVGDAKQSSPKPKQPEECTVQESNPHVRLVPLNLPTIELAGGSARCMLATIHLLLL